MYLMYVDESGDIGLTNSPSRYFVLAALVVHELRWQDTLNSLIQFRRNMKNRFGLNMREEIHAFNFISKPGPVLMQIKRNDRLTILRAFLDHLASLPDLNVFAVCVDKSTKTAGYEVFDRSWRALIQRFENTISHRNFAGPANPDERGILFADETERKRVQTLLRQMRHFNPIPNQAQFNRPGQATFRQLPLVTLVEDPSFRDSGESYFIQAVDTIAYFLNQQMQPNNYSRRKAAHNYFSRLRQIIVKQVSSTGDGIIRL